MSAQLGLVIISSLAFIVSLISLWRSYLAPFHLKVSYNSPTFTLHKISPDISSGKKIWWIPSIDINFSFFNLGKRAGEIIDIRFSGNLRTEETDKTFDFYAKWIVDFREFQQNRDSRLNWLETSIIRDYYPLILLGDEQKSFHIVFEGFRWDKKYTGNLMLSLELFSSEKSDWVEYENFELQITPTMFDETLTIGLSNEKMEKTRKDFYKHWDNI